MAEGMQRGNTDFAGHVLSMSSGTVSGQLIPHPLLPWRLNAICSDRPAEEKQASHAPSFSCR